MPYRTPIGNRVVSGVQLLIVIAALGFGYTIGSDVDASVWTLLLTIMLVLFALASTFYLVTGRSEGNTAVVGFPRPRVTRTLGFAAAGMFAVIFILTAVFGSADELTRSTILLNGLWGYLFVYLLASATIAQAQLMRERQARLTPSTSQTPDGPSASD
jgi:hypothetical protein